MTIQAANQKQLQNCLLFIEELIILIVLKVEGDIATELIRTRKKSLSKWAFKYCLKLPLI